MLDKKIKKPFLLCILDGFGIGNKADNHNAIEIANMQNYKRILKNYPNSQLTTSGLDVGLPDGQMGNSEVGHMTIGAGRTIFQDLPRINNAIANNELSSNPAIVSLIAKLKKTKKTCHLMGLLSDGGVHSHIDHIIFLADLLTKNDIKVLLHVFLDGRDVAQKSAKKYLKMVERFNIATISGRYYAMDRDQKWDRIEMTTNAMIFGCQKISPNLIFKNPDIAIEQSYQNNITDEFVKPCVINNYQGFEKDDAIIFANFRADRARQISQKLFSLFSFSKALGMVEYSEELNGLYTTIFPKYTINNSLGELISKNKMNQLRIAETEKYAHVTFFFSCGREKEFEGETRILVKSPVVATYDLKPEMSACEITQKIVESIKLKKFDFIVANYANPDMVGHSGCLQPSVKACEIIDQELKTLEEEILKEDGLMIITADHGNIECMLDDDGMPHTSHTTNPVPLVLVGNNLSEFKLKNGTLRDIATTILELLSIEKPQEMEGKNLIFKS